MARLLPDVGWLLLVPAVAALAPAKDCAVGRDRKAGVVARGHLLHADALQTWHWLRSELLLDTRVDTKLTAPSVAKGVDSPTLTHGERVLPAGGD
mmetsp:Transcript_11005/g.18757  ORF Transcript_11005/g.18757 Transcript_11005/m.18757 type:complete len:95 (-) Transcript_11005:1048-1332(-)